MASAWSKFATYISFKGGLFLGPQGDDATYTKMFRKLISEEEAKLGMHVPKTPTSVEEIAKAAKITVEDARKMLKHMSQKGVVFERIAGGQPFYNITPFIPGFYEYVMTDPETMKDPEMAYMFRDIASTGKIMTTVGGQDGGLLKVTPVMKEVHTQRKAYSFEDVLTFINNAHKYSIAPCACRLSAKLVGKGCEHPVEDTCLQFDDTADYYIRTGRGHEITKEEAIEALERVEKAGLVHTAFSVEGKDYTSFICNCCGCSCSGLRFLNIFDGNPFSRSNFRADINDEKCVACGECVKICPVNAVTLGTNFAEDEKSQLPEYKQAKYNRMSTYDERWNYMNERNTVATKGTSPCKTTCPAHISVQGYISKASEGKYLEALKVIKKDNPLPAVCGRVCPHPCETECTRGSVDAPIAIDAIKQFIADQELDKENRFVPEIKNDYYDKVAIIGSGPAGISCAYFLAEEGYKVTVFEKADVIGGMMTQGIPNFRLEKDIINAEIEVLKDMGVDFKTGVEVGKDVTIQQLRSDGYKAFYVAIGLQSGGRLGVPGEEAEGVMAGIDLMRRVNKGEEVRLDGNVVIIGGGNIGADVARSAVRCGADKVTLVCLEAYDDMPMGVEDRTHCELDGIEIAAGWGQTEVFSKDGKCTGLKLRKCLSVKNSEGRFDPKFDDNDTREIECSYVIYCIGQKTEWKDLLKGTKVAFTARGTAVADPVSYQTEEPDIFVGGDAYAGQKFVIDAIAMGKEGAISINRLLQNMEMTTGRYGVYRAIDKDGIVIGDYENIPRQETAEVDIERAKKTFHDLRGGLTEEQILKEATRCLKCGRSVVDKDRCIGCGVCTHRCDFDAIHLVRVSDSTPADTFGNWYKRLASYTVQRTGRIAMQDIKNMAGKIRKDK